MPHDEVALSLLSPDAPRWNRDLLNEFQAALEKDPAADLLSIFTHQYRREHRLAQSTRLSETGKINIKTLDRLDIRFRIDPEIDLLSAFPPTYRRTIAFAAGPKIARCAEDQTSSLTPDFRTKLDDVDTATVVSPLSEEVQSLLARCTSRPGADAADAENHSLPNALKHLLWISPKLWGCHFRGVVVQCSNDVVAKVIMGNNNYTEYTSMEYLKEKAPDIPAPRPHGLVALGPFRVIFMSYIPGVTLPRRGPIFHRTKSHPYNSSWMISFLASGLSV